MTRVIRPWVPRALAARLALALSTLIVGICATLSIVLVQRDFAEIRAAVVERGRTIAEFVAREAELSMLAGNVAGLQQLARVARGQHDIAYCNFFEANGSELGGSGASYSSRSSVPAEADGPVGPIDVATEVWEFRAPIFTIETQPMREELEFLGAGQDTERKKWLGTVSLGVALGPLREHRRKAFLTVASSAILVTLLAVAAAVLLTRRFAKPLRALASAADAIAEGDLSRAAVQIEGDDEVATVARSFNAMVTSLAHSRETLEARTRRLEQLNQKLEDADRLKSEFLAHVSHELRTPLNVILGYAEMMQDGAAGELSDDQRVMLAAIIRYSRLQLELVTDVLDLSRITSGRVTFRLERFALLPLLVEIRELHPPAPSVTFALDVSPQLPAIESDRVKVQEIVRNLVGNAVKFTAAGSVCIRAYEDCGDRVVIEVEDTGPGIAEDEIATIFDEFRQLSHGMTRASQGVGLGLSIARRLTEALRGSISVTSSVGAGTCFRIELPVCFTTSKRQSAA